VITHAALIAEKLQGAHERRTRGQDMIMNEDANPELRAIRELAERGGSLWDDDPIVHAHKLTNRLLTVLNDLAASGHAPGEPQASAVSAERVVELERQRNEVQEAYGKVVAETAEVRAELERELRKVEAELRDTNTHLAALGVELSATQRELQASYVVREVPWTDVAAGMMTLSREEHPRPWMVESWTDGAFILTNGVQTFHKEPADGETVRVLVPYVTGEQAESLVKGELGGTEAGS
jgi:hypothetical protein